MPSPHYLINLPPGFEIIEEPSQLGHSVGGLYAALVADDRGREGVTLTRQTRGGAVRSMIIFGSEAVALNDFLYSRFSSAR